MSKIITELKVVKAVVAESQVAFFGNVKKPEIAFQKEVPAPQETGWALKGYGV